jgi:hypothetical protein
MEPVSITTEGRSSSLCAAVGVANSHLVLDDGERGKNGSWAWARSGRGRDFVFRQLVGKLDSLLWFCRLKNRCTTSCLSIWETTHDRWQFDSTRRYLLCRKIPWKLLRECVVRLVRIQTYSLFWTQKRKNGTLKLGLDWILLSLLAWALFMYSIWHELHDTNSYSMYNSH